MLQKEDDDWAKKCMEYEVEGPRPRAVERGSGGKLPRAPRQRRGPVIPLNEFFYRHGMKAEADNSSFNFY